MKIKKILTYPAESPGAPLPGEARPGHRDMKLATRLKTIKGGRGRRRWLTRRERRLLHRHGEAL